MLIAEMWAILVDRMLFIIIIYQYKENNGEQKWLTPQKHNVFDL